MDQYEFKVRLICDKRPWEAIAPLTRLEVTPEDATALASWLAASPAVVEIRFNADGSHQGHYVPGSMETRARHRQLA
jgi:hypothetical protein